ncbi:aspartate--tRNA ligase 2, cytoplasmic-like isoform X5 [Syzygium oleosum]|uniref:aspartate--tRNA ligase 2, cytoplasmic-like isoform X5 n=1 Tax=Syzygium oleosum TaxID=219896 RepID=UPI0024B9B51D|nr:aspartate--tRNA ligase 2, cytoplasmic-like isoform X5 [Syzygium oleosum]
MAICGDFGCVFEIGPIFRAEDSFTHRHLCEFTGLDVEMEIKKHYCEVMDIVDKLFVTMFDSLNASCKKELEAIERQYPFEPLKYLRKTLRLSFQEDVQMLKVLKALHFIMLPVVEVCSVVRRTALSNSA